MTHSIHIDGIPSGDGECWCFLVDARTFESVVGESPEEEFDSVQVGAVKMYRLYPSALIGGYANVRVRLKIEVDQLDS